MEYSNSEELSVLFNAIFALIEEHSTMSSVAFDAFFTDFHLVSFDSKKIVFGTKSELGRGVIVQRYMKLIETAVDEALGFLPDIEVICDGIYTPEPGVEEITHTPQITVDPEDYVVPVEPRKPETRGLNPDYTFDNFVVGMSNQLAHACSIAVAEDSSGDHGYNPLFIHGTSGLGKTHLMYAIANRFHEKYPEKTIICAKSEDFLNELVECLAKKQMTKFRDKYRTVDMLLLDDVQFIAGKQSMQLEFFHTFERLYADKKQMVLTSDRPPKEMYTLENRIQTRFEQGMIVDVQPPEYELRLAILRKKAEKGKLDIPTDVISFLAEKLNSNVREIEGAIKKIGAVSFLSGKPITLEMVKSSIPEYFKENRPVAETVNTILEITARKYDTTVQEILGKSRLKDIKTARNVAMYVIRKVLDQSLPNIGKMMNRDYSTVHSNIKAIETEIQTNDKLNNDIIEIIAEVKS